MRHAGSVAEVCARAESACMMVARGCRAASAVCGLSLPDAWRMPGPCLGPRVTGEVRQERGRRAFSAEEGSASRLRLVRMLWACCGRFRPCAVFGKPEVPRRIRSFCVRPVISVCRRKKIPPPGRDGGRRNARRIPLSATCFCCGTRTDADLCRTSLPCS